MVKNVGRKTHFHFLRLGQKCSVSNVFCVHYLYDQVGQATTLFQGIVGCTPTNVPRHGKSLYKPYSSWVFMSYNPQELRIPREHNKYIMNTMGTLLGVHPIVP